MQTTVSEKRSFRKLLTLVVALVLFAVALTVAGPWEPQAQARPCCSSCPPDDMEDHCWDVCAFSC